MHDINLWLFTRQPIPPPGQVAEVRRAAKRLGFDISVLQRVPQQGCTYEGVY